jgi:hypothetical protein
MLSLVGIGFSHHKVPSFAAAIAAHLAVTEIVHQNEDVFGFCSALAGIGFVCCASALGTPTAANGNVSAVRERNGD